jgi:hypothetical protein
VVYSPSAEVPRSIARHYRGRRPPGPRGWPLVGNLLALGKDPLGFLTETTRQYGNLVSLNLAGWQTLLISDLPAIEKILVEEHRSYAKNRFFWRNVTALFGKGLLTSEGEPWQRQRHLAAPVFAGRQLPAYGGAVVALTRTMLDCWNDGEVFDVHPEMMALTLRIAAKTLFDADLERDIRAIDHAMNDLIVEVASRWKRPVFVPDAIPLPGHLRYRRAIRTIEGIVSSMIAERRASGLENRNDCLSRLLRASPRFFPLRPKQPYRAPAASMSPPSAARPQAPPRQTTWRGSAQKSRLAAPSAHSNAQFGECQSNPSNKIALSIASPSVGMPRGQLRSSKFRTERSVYCRERWRHRDCRDKPIARQRGLQLRCRQT